MFVKPRSAFVGKPSVVASSSGSAKYARYARLLPSTRKSSESRAGASSRSSSTPVSVFGLMTPRYRPAPMSITVTRGHNPHWGPHVFLEGQGGAEEIRTAYALESGDWPPLHFAVAEATAEALDP